MYGYGNFPLGLSGLFGADGNKLTMKEVEDKVRDWVRDTDPGIVALTYFVTNRAGITLSDCPSRIAELKRKLEKP